MDFSEIFKTHSPCGDPRKNPYGQSGRLEIKWILMKQARDPELSAYCHRPEAYRKIAPEVQWTDYIPGACNLSTVMDELRRPKSILCLHPIKLRDLLSYTRNQLIVCLDDHFSKEELTPLFPLAIDFCRIDGKLMAIPEDFSPYTFFTRHDLLQRFDFQPPKTLVELQKQLVRVKKKTGKAGFHVDSGGSHTRIGFITGILGAFGVELGKSLEHWGEHPDRLIEAYEWIRDLHRSGLMNGMDLFLKRLNTEPTAARIKHYQEDFIFVPHWYSNQHQHMDKNNFKRLSTSLLPPASPGIEQWHPFSGHGWVVSANSHDPVKAIQGLKKTLNINLIKENELLGGFPFVVWHDLWKDPDVLKQHPFAHWNGIFRSIKNACLINVIQRKFELLDETFRYAMRENLSGKEWLRSLLTHEIGASKTLANNDFVQKALLFVENNLEKIHSTRQVADHLKISPNYFSFLFQKKMKITFGTYLRKIRLERAYEMIKEGRKSIKSIGTELGFQHPQTFSRAFRHFFGKSPSEVTRTTDK